MADEPRGSRPRFASAYGIPESAEGLLSWSWVTERLSSTRNFWVGSTKPDGAPHAMPVWAVLVDGSLIFSTSPLSRKGRNLARDPRISLHVEADDDVIVIEGTVELVELGDRLAEIYEAKYHYRPTPGSADDAWYRLLPRVAYAWDRDFPRTVTCFRFSRD